MPTPDGPKYHRPSLWVLDDGGGTPTHLTDKGDAKPGFFVFVVLRRVVEFAFRANSLNVTRTG